MPHYASHRFWSAYRQLPEHIRALADRSYELLESDPHHPSLHLKKVGKRWSVRIGRDHRALGIEVPDGFRWVWIGTHAEYDRLLRSRDL
ncbi:MAG: hypothetical protein AB7E81_06435 [Hyphomicrobiaceae bacterium]